MEREIVLKIRHFVKGSKIAVYPLSTKFGDPFTAYGDSCHGDTHPVELSQPFHGIFEDFDGDFIYVRTDNIYCLKINVSDLRDIALMG